MKRVILIAFAFFCLLILYAKADANNNESFKLFKNDGKYYLVNNNFFIDSSFSYPGFFVEKKLFMARDSFSLYIRCNLAYWDLNENYLVDLLIKSKVFPLKEGQLVGILEKKIDDKYFFDILPFHKKEMKSLDVVMENGNLIVSEREFFQDYGFSFFGTFGILSLILIIILFFCKFYTQTIIINSFSTCVSLLIENYSYSSSLSFPLAFRTYSFLSIFSVIVAVIGLINIVLFIRFTMNNKGKFKKYFLFFLILINFCFWLNIFSL
jgi:hypothetical protein